jgi:hypothetical protein
MKKSRVILAAMIALTINANSQIPNSGFESLSGWYHGNATLSADHYPESVGSYSIRLENQLPLEDNSSYGFAVTNKDFTGCAPSFPVTGHPTKLCGYYKCTPLNNDTMQVGIELFKNGVWIAGGEFLCTKTVSEWSSFSLTISDYAEADSATISVAAFYNDTTCRNPYGPYGNSVLLIDNLSFDSLITEEPSSIKGVTGKNNSFCLSPNPASGSVIISSGKINKPLTVTVFSSNGTLFRTEKPEKSQNTINVSGFPEGVYFVIVKSDDATETKKLIIQR